MCISSIIWLTILYINIDTRIQTHLLSRILLPSRHAYLTSSIEYQDKSPYQHQIRNCASIQSCNKAYFPITEVPAHSTSQTP